MFPPLLQRHDQFAEPTAETAVKKINARGNDSTSSMRLSRCSFTILMIQCTRKFFWSICAGQTQDPHLATPFFKFLFPLPSFLFRPLLRYFRQSPHPHADNPLPVLLQHTNLPYTYTKFIFYNLKWFFFIKLWWQKKIIFLQIHNTILQRVQISKCNNDNNAEVKQKKCHSPLIKRPVPAPCFHPLFNFLDSLSPSEGGN